jgi:hypothetical protein
MPYESTIVVSIPDQGSYQDIKEHISACTSLHGMEPDRWSICVTSEENSSWAFVYYSHPSPGILDLINNSWRMKFPDCAIERVHRITNGKFFSDLARETKSGLVGGGMVHQLMELSQKGVTTMGMIDWMQDVKTDSEMILSSLKKIREAPDEPGKDVEAYP